MIFRPICGAGSQKTHHDKRIDGELECPVLRIPDNIAEEDVYKESEEQHDKHDDRQVDLDKICEQSGSFPYIPHKL
jgi:hypothetical protein